MVGALAQPRARAPARAAPLLASAVGAHRWARPGRAGPDPGTQQPARAERWGGMAWMGGFSLAGNKWRAAVVEQIGNWAL